MRERFLNSARSLFGKPDSPASEGGKAKPLDSRDAKAGGQKLVKAGIQFRAQGREKPWARERAAQCLEPLCKEPIDSAGTLGSLPDPHGRERAFREMASGSDPWAVVVKNLFVANFEAACPDHQSRLDTTGETQIPAITHRAIDDSMGQIARIDLTTNQYFLQIMQEPGGAALPVRLGLDEAFRQTKGDQPAIDEVAAKWKDTFSGCVYQEIARHPTPISLAEINARTLSPFFEKAIETMAASSKYALVPS